MDYKEKINSRDQGSILVLWSGLSPGPVELGVLCKISEQLKN